MKEDPIENDGSAEKKLKDPCEDIKHEEPVGGHLRSRFIIGAALVIAALCAIGFLPRYFHWKELEDQASKEGLVYVRTMSVKPDTASLELVLPSSTEAIRITPLWARTDGYLSNFFADIGDVVKEGQLLAVIDTPEVDQQVDQAKADLASAIARRDIARISADRWQDLYNHNPKAISTQEVDERNSTYTSAKADVIAAEANLKRLEKLQGFKNIYAPFNGVIIERDIDIGSLITAGSNGNPQQLFRIAKTDILRVFVQVPQYYFRMIFYGQTADVLIREFPDRVFKGVVARTSKALDPIARTLLTEVHIDNKERLLFPGLYANVKFTLQADTPRFIIPTEAVIIRAGDPQVAVVRDDHTIELRTVKIGLDMGKSMEIIDGLKDKDVIVINPTDKIRNGTHVQIMDNHPAS